MVIIIFIKLIISSSGKFWENTENNSKWNAVIRFYLESFLEINMGAFINMLAVRILN